MIFFSSTTELNAHQLSGKLEGLTAQKFAPLRSQYEIRTNLTSQDGNLERWNGIEVAGDGWHAELFQEDDKLELVVSEAFNTELTADRIVFLNDKVLPALKHWLEHRIKLIDKPDEGELQKTVEAMTLSFQQAMIEELLRDEANLFKEAITTVFTKWLNPEDVENANDIRFEFITEFATPAFRRMLENNIQQLEEIDQNNLSEVIDDLVKCFEEQLNMKNYKVARPTVLVNDIEPKGSPYVPTSTTQPASNNVATESEARPEPVSGSDESPTESSAEFRGGRLHHLA